MHAYNYGFRRAAANDYATYYPLDENGLWYNDALAHEAEEMWREHFRQRRGIRGV
jgi:hypothetical protein